jgi:glycerol kinase
MEKDLSGKYILSIDQGTTSSRVLVIDRDLNVLDSASREHK